MRGISYILILTVAASVAKGSLLKRQTAACLNPCDAIDDNIGCESNDSQCHCTNQDYLDAFEACANANCKPSVVEELLKEIALTCAPFQGGGGTTKDAGPAPSDSGTGGASTTDESTLIPFDTAQGTSSSQPSGTGPSQGDSTDNAWTQHGLGAVGLIGLVVAQPLVALFF